MCELEELRERVALLERDLLGSEIVYPEEWKITPCERRFLGLLICRVQASDDQLMTALYFDKIDDWPDSKIIDVMACKLRRRLARFGVEIETMHSYGYRIPPDCRERLRHDFEYTYTKAY